MSTPQRLSEDARRAQLLASGRMLFAETSYDALSTRELAARAGISKGLLFHYFGSKRGYYLAVIGAAADELLAAVDLDPELGLAAALDRGLRGFLSWVTDHAALYRALLRGGLGADPEANAIVEEVRSSLRDQVLAVLGVEEPPPRLRLLVGGWIGLTEAASLDWLAHDDLDQDALVGLLSESLLALLAGVEHANVETRGESA